MRTDYCHYLLLVHVCSDCAAKPDDSALTHASPIRHCTVPIIQARVRYDTTASHAANESRSLAAMHTDFMGDVADFVSHDRRAVTVAPSYART